jgi:DNA repair photolyase
MSENKTPTPGRGAISQTPNRFEQVNLEPLEIEEDIYDDPIEGLSTAAPRKRRTIFYRDRSRTVLTENDSPDVGIEASVNPYRGCEHGCIYCYARPTHEYLGFSAGVDFESRIMVKEEAPALLREKLLSPNWEPRTVTFSGVTDCYQPVERKLQITRKCLQVLAEFGNPFLTISKNHLVTRDIDVIAPMAAKNAAASFVTVTSLDAELCGILEPRTSRPEFRLKAIEELSRAGIPVGVMIAPIIPGLTDHEVPSILAEAASRGARFAGCTLLRLPLAVSPLFQEWLEAHYPDRKERVLSLIRSWGEGNLHDSDFGTRMRGKGEFAAQVRALFKIHCAKNGLNREDLGLTTENFQRPGEQMRLF